PLETSLVELVDATARTLDLDETKRKNTVWRIDGGGGSETNRNAWLARDYPLLVKLHNWHRARKWAATVGEWFADSKVPAREIGWVMQPHRDARVTQPVAIRKRNAKGKWTDAVIVSTLLDAWLSELTGLPCRKRLSARERALRMVQGYDLRGGGA